MKHLTQIIKNDFKNYIKYGILQTVLILSIFFSVSMSFLPQIDPLIFIYITIFVLPVIIFSISIYIENEEQTLFPLAICDCSAIEIILGKIVSACLVLLMPMILYIVIMYLFLHMNFNISLFILVYLLSSIMHIVIGIVLAIISKSNRIMSISYIGYIVIFSVMPIFYTQGMIPEFFQYVLIVSPAYLSGILFEQVIVGYIHVSSGLTILAVVLQIAYIVLLSIYVIKPYFKMYLFYRTNTVKGESEQ